MSAKVERVACRYFTPSQNLAHLKSAKENFMTSEVDVAIIGAGTAGLTAQEFVAEIRTADEISFTL